jgi:hypothetical protein
MSDTVAAGALVRAPSNIPGSIVLRSSPSRSRWSLALHSDYVLNIFMNSVSARCRVGHGRVLVRRSINLAQAAFFGIGAYAKFKVLARGLHFWISFMLGWARPQSRGSRWGRRYG